MPAKKGRTGFDASSAPLERDQQYHTGTPTPPVKSVRIRPRWHRVIGIFLLAGGLVVAILNELKLGDKELLPGGHTEFYLLLSVAIAGCGTWWLGWFDED